MTGINAICCVTEKMLTADMKYVTVSFSFVISIRAKSLLWVMKQVKECTLMRERRKHSLSSVSGMTPALVRHFIIRISSAHRVEIAYLKRLDHRSYATRTFMQNIRTVW